MENAMQTPLDIAHSAMENAPEDGAASLRFYERFCDAELFLILEQEARGDTARPLVFDLSDGRYALVFDREDRLADFVSAPTPFVAMSGRRVARLLAGEGIGLGLNLGGAPSGMLLPPDAVDWLDSALGVPAEETTARPQAFHPPAGIPEALLTGFDAKLANMSGVVDGAFLAGVTYDNGQRGHMLALVGVAEVARPGVAEALAEALRFNSDGAAQIDITFVSGDAPYLAALVKVALGFEIPALVLPEMPERAAPGMDPDKPPKLR